MGFSTSGCRIPAMRLVTLIALLALAGNAYAACPADDTVLSANTTYSSQVCAVDDSGNDGVLQIGANSITLDCAGTVFVGSMRGIAIANPGYDNVTIKNCKITDYNVGIWLHTAANSNVIRKSDINQTNFGINILASTDANIWDNNIDHNNSYGIYLDSDSNRAWIKDNNLSDNNNTGIYVSASGDINILRNEISYNGGGGIDSSNSGDLNIADNNLISNYGSGVNTSDTYRVKVTDNNIQGNDIGGGEAGISAVKDMNILRNTIISNGEYGIFLGAAGDNVIISGNTLRWNLYGIYSGGVFEDVNIHNNIIDQNNKWGIFSPATDVRWSITDNNISDNNNFGIEWRGTDANILRNKISYNKTTGIDFDGTGIIKDNNIIGNRTYGVYLNNAADDNVSDNNISYNVDTGIYIKLSATHIQGNKITNNLNYGIYSASNRTDLNVIKNNITNNGDGGLLDSGVAIVTSANSDTNIWDNNIHYNNPYGVLAYASGDVNISDSNFVGNGYGVVMYTQNNYTVKGNRFRKNMYAILVSTTVNDLNIIGNTIDGNNGWGIALYKAVDDANIYDNNISDNNLSGIWGYAAGGNPVTDVNIFNTIVKNNATYDINLEDTNISFIDGNYGAINFTGNNAKIERYWAVDVNVKNSTDSNAVTDANIDINTQYNTAIIDRMTTGIHGSIVQLTILQFDQNADSTGPYQYTPHSFIVAHPQFDSNTYVKTIDSNYDLIIYLTPKGVSISSPQNGQVLTNPHITFSYSASSEFTPVNKYWVRLDDQARFTDNGTSITYSATFSSGAHTFYVKANGPGDLNSSVATVSFTINLGAGVAACGDGVCGSGETAASCAADCPPVCGDNACTGTETPETCAADCVVGCGDNICDPDVGEACGTCASDCGECAPGEEQLPEEETVLEQTQTAQATVQQIEDVLRDVGFTVSEIASAKEASTKLGVARTITVEKKTADEGVPESYESRITLAVTNTTSSALKNVRIVEVVPKSVANTADEVTSARPFAVLKSDPVIQFSISEIPAGGTAEVKYSLAKKLTEEQIANYMPAVPAYAIEAAEATCANVKCDDKNPCTDDLCFDGECAYVYAKDGTTCGFGAECTQGICRSLAFARSTAAGAGIDMMTLTAIVVVVAAAAVGLAVYIRRRS